MGLFSCANLTEISGHFQNKATEKKILPHTTMFLKLAVAKCTVDFMSLLILSSLSLIIKFT